MNNTTESCCPWPARQRAFRSLACAVLALCFSAIASAQTLSLTAGVAKFRALTNTTVTMTNRCELWVTNATAPLSGCVINLNSADAFLVMPGIKPSVAASTYLSQVRVSGAAAVADSNCRIVQYGMGSVIVPHSSSFTPLQVFTGPHFTGASSNLAQYVYYNSALTLGLFNANISSFKLKRGYAATFAQSANGSDYSKNYVAADGDVEISVLPSTLDQSVRFIYVTPWRWTAKKGIAGNPGNSLLNVQWWYNWNLDQNSSRDLEYVPIRQQRWWPSLSQTWKTRGANSLLGYNEPDHTDQANIAVGDAISSWPDLLATGLRVGAPAVSDGGRSSWLYPFMSQADDASLRVDFVPLHYYQCHAPTDPSGAASQMYNFLKATYDQVQRPLWVTEWNNGANWTTCADPSYSQQQACVAAMINMLDSTPFVERYALYNWVEDVRAVVTNGVLTSAGVSYRDQYSPIGYVQSVPNNGMRSFTQLRFETNTWDSSGYGNNGVTAGCPAYTNGYSGQAMVFDGTNTVVTLPPNVAANNAFTFAAWIKWNGGPNWQRIFDFGNSTTHFMFLTPNAGSVMRFAIANGGSEQRVETTPLPSGSWQHVALTLSGSTARLYTNGVQAAVNSSMSITPASFAPRVNRLGKSQFNDPLFSGLMDEVLITDYALSASQVARLLTNTPPQFASNIIIRATATEGVAYSNNIAGTASDADPGDTISYSKAVGPDWLSVSSSGAISGTPTAADAGSNYFTVRITDAAGVNGFAILAILVNPAVISGTWAVDASGTWGNSNNWTGQLVPGGTNQLADFSTINITANRTVTVESSRTIGTMKFGDASGAQSWTLAASNGVTLKLDSGSAASPQLIVTNTVSISASLAGTNGFTKTGPGTLMITGNNSLSGTVNIDSSSASVNDGITRLVGPNSLRNATQINIRNNNSGSSTLQLDGSTGSITVDADLNVTCRNNGVVTIDNLAGTNIFNGKVFLQVGGNAHTVQAATNSLIVFTGPQQYVGSLTGSRTLYFTGSGNHLLVGPILNSTNGAPTAFSKSGTGTLVTEGENTYGNGTTLTGGTMIVNGSVPAGSFAISSGTTLGGNGMILPAVTLPAGASFAPGNSGIGTLTISNNVSLQPGSVTAMEISSTGGSNDQLVVIGSLTYGGTLLVSNVSGEPWVGGVTYPLFTASTRGGYFSQIIIQPPLTNMAAVFNAANGTLSIVSDSVAATASLVATGAVWKYFDQTNDLGTAWRSNSYNDTSWSSGPAMLGYGDANGILPRTLVASNRQWTTYFRRPFYVPDRTLVQTIGGRVLRDDAAVIYLNGVEVWRDTNITSGVITNATPAFVGLGGAEESTWLDLTVNPAALVNGTNIIAIEVHQNAVTSSDVSLDFELTGSVVLPSNLPLSLNGNTVSWPGSGAWLSIFGTTNITPPVSWIRLTNAPAFISNEWRVTLPAVTNGQRFFRLQSQ